MCKNTKGLIMGMSKKREDELHAKVYGRNEDVSMLSYDEPRDFVADNKADKAVARQKAIEKSRAERMKKAKKARALAKRKEEEERVMNSSDEQFEKENPKMRGL